MEPLCMACQRSELKASGLDQNSIEVALSAPAQTAHNLSYVPIQNHFADWCQGRSVSPTCAKASHIINFLATHHLLRGWKMSTIMGYHSALLDLQPEAARKKITESTVFKAFFAGILADTVLIMERESVDVAPILASFCATELAHLSVELCLVAVLKYYIATVIVANKVEHTRVTHLRIPRLSFRLLMCNVTDPALAVSSDCILNDIQRIMSLSPTSDGAPASTHSVGADLAIQARIPIEEVANQGGWAGTAIVEAHYRRSQHQHSRITKHVLGGSVEDISQIAD
ncbi:hypothetical protein GGI24_001971 [Coemansia furcata]|nr:hypothetical protein GGI24_001971 [Coemansia furcata]